MTQVAFAFDEEQEEHLARVSSRIASIIMTFARDNLGAEFHMDLLRLCVAHNIGTIAPASTDRVLRDLRQRGRLNYVVVNRRQSLYKITEVE